MSRFFHWYTTLTASDVNWTELGIVLLFVAVLFMYIESWLAREREDRRDDEVRLLKLQVQNLQKLDTYSAKTVVTSAPTIQVQDSDLIFDQPSSDRYRHLFIGKPPVSK